MRTIPRLLAIVGSGETTTSAARVHRSILERFGATPVPATLIDTPYGFQENAAGISSDAVDYFERRLRNPVSVASFRGADQDAVARATALERIREADYVFSGPGSPSYALRHWRGSDVARALADKLATGGAVVMASAAALALGRFTIPVYELYKVGEEPHWLTGLDLPAAWGWSVAIVPHYDNAEGRGHDTRFCFLGERRLRVLEDDMPDEAFVLGVDEHTTVILDLDARRATIAGRGGVTVRRQRQSTFFGPNAEVSFDEIIGAAFGSVPVNGAETHAAPSADPLRADSSQDAERARRAFGLAIESGDVRAAAEAIISAASGRLPADLTSMLVRLADTSDAVTSRSGLVAPLVDALVDARSAARSRGDWDGADEIRKTLLAAGVELHDRQDGTAWSLDGDGRDRAAATSPRRAVG